MKRKTPMRRGRPLARVNKERAAKRRAECFGPQAELCRVMPCLVCNDIGSGTARRIAFSLATGWPRLWPLADPHHEPPRSIGGKDGDTVPLCREHHTERHTIGRSAFERLHGVDLRAVAKAIRESVAKAAECRQDEDGR
jgi:hypothetical protein